MPYLQLGDIWGLWAKTSDLAVHHDPRRRSYAVAVVDYSTIQATPVPNLLHDPRAGHHLLHPPPLQRKGKDTVGGKAQPHHWALDLLPSPPEGH